MLLSDFISQEQKDKLKAWNIEEIRELDDEDIEFFGYLLAFMNPIFSQFRNRAGLAMSLSLVMIFDLFLKNESINDERSKNIDEALRLDFEQLQKRLKEIMSK